MALDFGRLQPEQRSDLHTLANPPAGNKITVTSERYKYDYMNIALCNKQCVFLAGIMRSVVYLVSRVTDGPNSEDMALANQLTVRTGRLEPSFDKGVPKQLSSQLEPNKMSRAHSDKLTADSMRWPKSKPSMAR